MDVFFFVFPDNPKIKWMMTGGRPILGNLDISVFFDKQWHWTMVVFECINIDTGGKLRQGLEVCPLNELLDDADDGGGGGGHGECLI